MSDLRTQGNSHIDLNTTGRQVLTAEDHRIASLEAWLVFNGWKKRELAERLGVSPSMVTRIIKGTRAPKERIEKLIELGLPAELLPKPSGPPGRPPKKKASS